MEAVHSHPWPSVLHTMLHTFVLFVCLFVFQNSWSPWLSGLDKKKTHRHVNIHRARQTPGIQTPHHTHPETNTRYSLHLPLLTVHPKGNHKRNQSWIFIGRTDAEAEAPILWPPDEKNCLTRKDPDAAKDWRQEEKGSTEDVMVGRHHQLYGHEF